VTVLKFLCTSNQTHINTIEQIQADLCIIAVFFLLRVGEYTYQKPTQRRRTTQFCLKGIRLWEGTTLLSPRLSMEVLSQRYTAATLTIDNQKNGKHGTIIHHHTNDAPSARSKQYSAD
jgi:hypothetical protein